jgi:hypothetical protein
MAEQYVRKLLEEEVEYLDAQNHRYRAALERISSYARCSPLKHHGTIAAMADAALARERD